MRTHTGEKPHQCQDCGQFFKFNHRLNYHNCINGVISRQLKKNENGYTVCPYSPCDYQCKLSGAMLGHIRSVHERVKYPCNQCDHQASTQGNLHAHIQAKHEVVRYPCNFCDYKATTQGSLKNHIWTRHEGVRLQSNTAI